MNQNRPQKFYNHHFAKKCLKADYILTILIGLFLTLQSVAQIVTTTFNYTGSLQTFTVPSGITTINIDARGAQGGSVTIACAATGGIGARMVVDIEITPGEVITILVGGDGQNNDEQGGGGC